MTETTRARKRTIRALRKDTTGELVHIPLALTANRHGRAIGQTVAGDQTKGGGIAGTAAIKAFEVETARTGILDHQKARRAGFISSQKRSTQNHAPGTIPKAEQSR